jgi:hypothetical protein
MYTSVVSPPELAVAGGGGWWRRPRMAAKSGGSVPEPMVAEFGHDAGGGRAVATLVVQFV